MFYPHSVPQQRENSETRLEQAKINIAKNGNEILAEMQILYLEEICKIGLPDCYDTFNDFLYDFYPNFTWSAQAQVTETLEVLNDKRFSGIKTGIKKLYNFDIQAELATSVKEIIAEK